MNNHIDVDSYNERVVAYFPTYNEQEIGDLEQTQRQHQPSKTIIYLKKEYVSLFVKKGYRMEGSIIGFFNGVDGYVVSLYGSKERKTSKKIDQQGKILKTVEQIKPIHKLPPLDTKYSIRLASHQDVKGLVQLYDTVFQKYPTPVFDENYVRKVMNDDYFFIIIKDGEKVVSAASAMINPFRSAEITDCATDPNYRGKQFLSQIIIRLEEELINRDVNYAYSLTRALSAGMNVTIKRLGYKYGGKLINNCIISSGFEDMCIWSKQLKKADS
ncbi:putative beta-lysine N-acetyltransferase [Alkalihalophilus pseudofirmus]|nr:putative beta-lysine N-acetyltransferase [Alkalihalophilus pseudofirmus]